MMNRILRSATLGLLASTALGTPALAQTGVNNTPPSPKAQVAQDGNVSDSQEIVVTAQKREENLSKVPLSIQAIGTRRLDQLNISNFQQYTKQLPSVSFQTSQPGVTVVYMRGVATGGDGNHSGSLPSVGTYLDEQPVTTIGGTLDIHVYDIARIESLAGPQGTLYGASSQAGTIRIITNKPKLGKTEGRVDGEINALAHGGQGGKLEGMINLPVARNIAFRGVGFWQRDAGYIDNVAGSRIYCGTPVKADDPNSNTTPPAQITVGCLKDGISVNNSRLVKKNFNDTTTYGGRAALKIDLDDSWTVTPTVLYQNLKSNGNFSYDPKIGDLKIDRFFPEVRKDKFIQAAMTIEGKIANFDLTYAGAYLDRKTYTTSDYTDYSDAYDQLYSSYGGIANYFYFQDSSGQTVDSRQRIVATDHFRKMSHEIRLALPTDQPFRVIAGAFYQRQSNNIHQDYQVTNLAPQLSVNGHPGTLWLTEQKRIDRDYALFGEATYDFNRQLSLTAGGRLFRYDNSLIGFFGFGRDPNGPPYNGAGSSRTGVAGCFTTDGSVVRDGTGAAIITAVVPGTPCTNLGVFSNGRVLPKQAKGSGFTYRFNLSYKPQDGLLFYGTVSRGFRPGGINRRLDVGNYGADYLQNYELGWKAAFIGGAMHWNGAIYHQRWKKFQFAFLGANSFTEIHNGTDANIDGIETDLNYTGGGFTLTAAGAYTRAKTKGNICTASSDTTPNCTAAGDFIAAPDGTRLPITPRFKVTATARYSWPVFSAAKAHFQVGAAYQSSAPSSLRTQIDLIGPDGAAVCSQAGALNAAGHCNPNVFQGRIRSAALFDLATGIDWRAVDIELFVTNLFDKRNDLSRGVACGSCTRTLVVPGTPRTIGFRAGFKF